MAKVLKAVKATTKVVPVVKAVKAAPAKAEPVAAKPKVPLYDYQPSYTGTSSGVNRNVSRTVIDATRFASLTDAMLTERDRANLTALREQFGKKPFARSNVDAGIIRRLGERGYIEHVSGASNETTATYRLTGRKEAQAA